MIKKVMIDFDTVMEMVCENLHKIFNENQAEGTPVTGFVLLTVRSDKFPESGPAKFHFRGNMPAEDCERLCKTTIEHIQLSRQPEGTA